MFLHFTQVNLTGIGVESGDVLENSAPLLMSFCTCAVYAVHFPDVVCGSVPPGAQHADLGNQRSGAVGVRICGGMGRFCSPQCAAGTDRRHGPGAAGLPHSRSYTGPPSPVPRGTRESGERGRGPPRGSLRPRPIPRRSPNETPGAALPWGRSPTVGADAVHSKRAQAPPPLEATSSRPESERPHLFHAGRGLYLKYGRGGGSRGLHGHSRRRRRLPGREVRGRSAPAGPGP